MRSLLYRQSDTYAVHYGAAPLIQLSAEEAAEESEPVRQEPSREEDSPIENGTYVSQIPPMRVERVEEDQFGLDEVDRAELRRQEPEISRELAPYIRREVNRMESEGKILGDESIDPEHLRLSIENIMERLAMQRQQNRGNLEDLIRLLLLNEIFDRRRRCRRRGNCQR